MMTVDGQNGRGQTVGLSGERSISLLCAVPGTDFPVDLAQRLSDARLAATTDNDTVCTAIEP
jgi:hypothetical protein